MTSSCLDQTWPGLPGASLTVVLRDSRCLQPASNQQELCLRDGDGTGIKSHPWQGGSSFPRGCSCGEEGGGGGVESTQDIEARGENCMGGVVSKAVQAGVVPPGGVRPIKCQARKVVLASAGEDQTIRGDSGDMACPRRRGRGVA